MAATVLAFDSLDLYNGIGTNTGLQARWNGLNWFYSPQMTAGRFAGSQALMNGNGEGCVSGLPITAAGPGYGLGLAFRMNNLSSVNATNTGPCVGICAASFAEQFGYRVRNDGSISIVRNGTVLGATAAGVILNNTWHFIEIWGTLSTTVGTVNLKVDDVTVLTLTGLNNAQSGTTVFAGLAFGGQVFSSSGGFPPNNMSIDDIYFTDGAASLGQRKIEVIRPNADTAQKDFVPDTGTVNFSRVNATLAQSTTYVQSGVLNAEDLYAMSDLVSSAASIDAVQLIAFAQKTDAATRKIALVADVSAVVAQTADLALGTSISIAEGIMLTAPGGAAWTQTSVNALKVGPKVTV